MFYVYFCLILYHYTINKDYTGYYICSTWLLDIIISTCSHNVEDRCVKTDLVFQLIFIHCTMLSHFILLVSFLYDWWRKGEKLFKCCRWSMAYTYYGQMYMYLIASFVKIINTHNVYAIIVTRHEKIGLMYTKYITSHFSTYHTFCDSYTGSVNCTE